MNMAKTSFYRHLIGMLFLLGALSLVLGACGSSGGGGGVTPPPATPTGTVAGAVSDLTGTALAGVTVSATDGTAADGGAVYLDATTGADGTYSLEAPASSRVVVKFVKAGYVLTCRIVSVTEDETTYAPTAMLAAEGAAQDVDAAAGGTVTTADGGAVTFAANSLVDANGDSYTGTARVSVTTFNPATEAGLNAFPGDFEGVDTDGDTVPFQSYGFMDVTPRDDAGNSLQLAEGVTAEISIPIPLSLVASAPATIPLWYFDPADGLWKQVGTAAKDVTDPAKPVYKGTVNHFSIWNADHPYDRSFVKGRVVDGDGNPLAGVAVHIRGFAPRNNWATSCTTDADGKFPPNISDANPGLPVEADSTCEIWVRKSGQSNEPANFTSSAADAVLDLGDITWAAYTPTPTSYETLIVSGFHQGGVDFSTGATMTPGDPAADGSFEGWTETDYAYYSNVLPLETSHIKDMGAIPLTDVHAVPGDWDALAGGIPILIQEGHSYVIKCHDGYAKFYVQSIVGFTSVEIDYYFSATTTFDR